MKLLLISDVVIPFIYSRQVKERFADIELVIGCGDLPYYYQEYLISSLDVPLLYVRGNHSKKIEYSTGVARRGPLGGIDLHRQVVCEKGVLFAGVDGSVRYREGPYQYSQAGMWGHVFSIVPRLLFNRLVHGRFLDVFVTHAPPWKIHDDSDLPHQGIKAFRWFLRVFRPAYHFHGHLHIYHPDTVAESRFEATQVINAFGYRELQIEPRRRPKIGRAEVEAEVVSTSVNGETRNRR